MKTCLAFSVTILIVGNVLAQNVINPYDDYLNKEMPTYIINSSGYEFDTKLGNNSNYNGEYLVDFSLLWWFQNSGIPFASNYHKSYKLEVVGFPFMMSCLFNTGGCADNSTTTRILEMPNISLVNDHWNEVKRVDVHNLGQPSDYNNNLVTNAYNSANPITGSTKDWFPHTTHKYTVYLHCGNSSSSEIVDEISFIYDHTRGRMRDYPFMPINNGAGYAGPAWDVRFFARLVYKNYGSGHTYTETTNEDIYIHGNTVNYFPFSTNSTCTDFSNINDYFSGNPYGTQDEFWYIHPPPYALTSFHLYSGFSKKCFAGYDLSPQSPWTEMIIKPGIKHTYTIQNNYNITEISPEDKTIYNPSEVDIIADNLFFPSGYTFKTIRGVYPIFSEVALSIGVEGNYHDLRDVPVFTDLKGEDINDLTNDAPPRASKYYIKSNGKLTIEPCVTIYDATFLIESGGTLVFQDRESTYGRFEVFEEDASNNGTHTFTNQQGSTKTYNLIDKQGMVTRPVSLVPQGNTFLYESNDLIESGTAQQLPVNLNLPVTIAPETHVVFVAENEIKLTPGFHAKADHSPSGQSVFHALIWPSHCAGSGNRMMASNTNSQNNYQPQKFLYPTNPVLQPNPSRNNSRLHFSVLEDSKVSVKLYNAMGQLVNTPLNENVKEKGNHIVEIKTEGLQPGIYLCTLYTEVNGSKKPMQVSRKLVVE
jgi:hypothetical protein